MTSNISLPFWWSDPAWILLRKQTNRSVNWICWGSRPTRDVTARCLVLRETWGQGNCSSGDWDVNGWQWRCRALKMLEENAVGAGCSVLSVNPLSPGGMFWGIWRCSRSAVCWKVIPPPSFCYSGSCEGNADSQQLKLTATSRCLQETIAFLALGGDVGGFCFVSWCLSFVSSCKQKQEAIFWGMLKYCYDSQVTKYLCK